MAQPKNAAARRRPASRGFTIIEVLVAASISEVTAIVVPAGEA